MAPDVEDLIKRVNSLTLDKNRLRQKLTQLANDQNGKDTITRLSQLSMKAHQGSPIESSNDTNSQSLRSISDTLSFSSNSFEPSPPENENSPTATGISCFSPKNKLSSNVIVGIECATSCEDDFLYINNLLRKRVDEYNEDWDYIQSKCSALVSELHALQVHYGRLKNEKLEMDEKYTKKCEECDDVKGELQTVVLNYEAQLSAMSEHLSAITSHQIS
jgi:hypothetical protein